MEIGEFNDMFLPHRRMMFWAAWRSVSNRQEAEDIVQEALMKLWAQHDKLPPFHSTEAYCLTLENKPLFINQHLSYYAKHLFSPCSGHRPVAGLTD